MKIKQKTPGELRNPRTATRRKVALKILRRVLVCYGGGRGWSFVLVLSGPSLERPYNQKDKKKSPESLAVLLSFFSLSAFSFSRPPRGTHPRLLPPSFWWGPWRHVGSRTALAVAVAVAVAVGQFAVTEA